jgi:hypothetical protein
MYVIAVAPVINKAACKMQQAVLTEHGKQCMWMQAWERAWKMRDDGAAISCVSCTRLLTKYAFGVPLSSDPRLPWCLRMQAQMIQSTQRAPECVSTRRRTCREHMIGYMIAYAHA